MDTKTHLLIVLSDALADAQKSIAKSLRFGFDDVYNGQTNLGFIQENLADIDVIVSRLEKEGVEMRLSDEEFSEFSFEKEVSLVEWLEYSKKRGMLTDE